MANNINKDAVYRGAKPEPKNRMINDGGLFMLIKPNGAKLWHFFIPSTASVKDYTSVLIWLSC